MIDEEHDEGPIQGLRLDDRAGPARSMAANTNDALVASILDAWQPIAPPPEADAPDPSSPSTPTGQANPIGPSSSGTIAVGAGKAGVGAWVAAAFVTIVVGASVYVIRGVDPTPTTVVADESPIDSQAVEAPRSVPTESAPAPSEPPAVQVEPLIGAPDAHVPDPSIRAADLLARANEQRRSGRYPEAASTYQQVVALSPSSREALVARVAAGTIRLDRMNDPSGAARLFRIASRSSGGLAAEATFGLARALRASGDRAGEISALRDLVTRFSSSPYAAIAHRRLAELGVDVP